KDAGIDLKELKVDGGASMDNLLMQFQSDILGTAVIRPRITETTALGACYLAGLAVGYWDSIGQIRSQWRAEKIFTPDMASSEVERLKKGWKDAIGRSLSK
ncbi:MAG: glycerol kinase, partial [Bacteroidales bacterium]|nr:glycerol kinase [Bacteroidales bacterium]